MRWLVVIGLMALTVLGVSPAVAADPVRLPTHVVDGQVDALAFAGDTLYLGGYFETIGPRSGPGVGIDAATGAKLELPEVSGGAAASLVDDVIPDGAGGWYVAGHFERVGGVKRRNVARILADGTVGAWNPDVDGVVGTLVRSGSTVYLAGQFTSVGGEARRNVAAVDATTGAARAWNPEPNGAVSAIAVAGSTVYLGGWFTAVNGTVARNYAAAVSADTGAATSWDPNVRDGVNALAVSGSTVYLGGYFRSAKSISGNATRNFVAAVDAETGVATAWNPNANYEVYDLAVSGSTVYLSGAFHGSRAINGNVSRDFLAAVDATTGAATGWNPKPDRHVNALAVSGSTVYLAGEFRSVDNRERRYLAAVDATTGAVEEWSPRPNRSAYAVAATGGTVYAGGPFSSLNGVERHNTAAIDLTTGRPTAWNPDVDGGVLQIVVSGSTVYLGGTFQKVNGDKNRDRLASVDATTGVATAWAPTTTGWVSQMRVSGPTVYLAGRFSDVNGTSRNNLAAVTADSGTTTAWNPNVETSYPGASPVINSMAVLGSKVYVAGRIAKIGGVERSSVGAVDAQTGAVSPWAPVVDQEGAWALAAAGSQVYLGGQFGAVNGVARNHLASVDATTGALTDFNPNLKDPPYELAADGSNVHVFGNFDAPMVLGGTISRNFLVRLNPLTAAVADWEPGSTRRIAAIATAGADAFAAAGTEYSFGNDSFAVFGSAPRLTTQPAGQTVNDGVDAAFTAAVSGFPTPALQWQTSTDGATFSDLAGQTGTTLTLPAASAAQSGTRYRLRATSLAGTVVSDAAALTVLADEKPPQEQPPIAEQPPPMTLQPATNARPGRAHLVSRTATIRDGIARVTLGCTGATPCTGKLTLGIPGRRGTLISGRYAIRTEKQATLKLRVSGRAQRLLFKSRARRQTTVVLAATSGPPVRATLTLRRSRG